MRMYSAADNAAVSGVLMGVLGSIVGLIAGTVRGSRDVYTISRTPPSPTRFIPAGPSGSAVGATIRF